MAGLRFYKRIFSWLRKLFGHPLGVYIGFLLSLVLGIYIGTTFKIITPREPLKLVGAIAAGLSAVTIALFSIVKSVFDLEIKDRELSELEDKKNPTHRGNSTQGISDKEIIRDIVNGIKTHWQFHALHEENRSDHWRYEKQFLSEEFVDFLKTRIRNIQSINRYDRIAIIFDAGSTITPVLDTLGSEASKDQNHWTSDKNIAIYTNNLNGVLSLLKYRDFKEQDDRHANIPFKCAVLPGDVLSAYAATASDTTIDSILDLKKDEKTYVISVSTGNYIFLNLNSKHIAPIARTGKHPNIKSALATVADEIYYIAPLGKVILCNADESLENLRDRLNQAAGFSNNSKSSSMRSYKLSFECKSKFCTDHNDWYKKTILVSTARDAGTYFSRHSSKVHSGALTTMEINTGVPPCMGPYILKSYYDKLPPIPEEQEKIEVPHEYLRKNAKDFFATDRRF